jgi:thiol-disulfide isomerase/thioredoxin
MSPRTLSRMALSIAVVSTVLLAEDGPRSVKLGAGLPQGASSPVKGTIAPDFSLVTLDGKATSLVDFRGKAVLLNFWATWCEPCKIEMPWLIELQKQYGPQGLQVLGIALDDADTKDIAKFAQDMHVDYPILVGKDDERESIANAYGGVEFLPETFYLDRDGKILDKTFGLVKRSEIKDNIKKALASGSASSGE